MDCERFTDFNESACNYKDILLKYEVLTVPLLKIGKMPKMNVRNTVNAKVNLLLRSSGIKVIYRFIMIYDINVMFITKVEQRLLQNTAGKRIYVCK